MQNSPLESGCVIVALKENYSTSRPLKVSPEKLQILSCDTVVTNVQHTTGFLFSFVVLLMPCLLHCITCSQNYTVLE